MSLLHMPRARRGVSYPIEHEPFWGWTVRPASGWRSRRHRWMPPLYFTRRIPATQRDAAADWGMERMGL